MISLGDFLVFVGAVGVAVTYILIVHHFMKGSPEEDLEEKPATVKPAKKPKTKASYSQRNDSHALVVS